MKEKLTFNDIRPLIDGDPVAIFKDGWGEEDLVYEDSLTYDEEKYQNPSLYQLPCNRHPHAGSWRYYPCRRTV